MSAGNATKLLFICSRNKWRSLTAEKIYEGFPGYEVRSAGTSPGARVRVSAGHIGWADVIFVMEKKHRQILEQKFADALAEKAIICLQVPDDFEYMDPELIALLKAKLGEYVPVPD